MPTVYYPTKPGRSHVVTTCVITSVCFTFKLLIGSHVYMQEKIIARNWTKDLSITLCS